MNMGADLNYDLVSFRWSNWGSFQPVEIGSNAVVHL